MQIAGPDAARFTQMLVVRDLRKFEVGGALRFQDKGFLGYYGKQKLPATITELDRNNPIWDKGSFYNRLTNIKQFGIEQNADRIGAIAAGASDLAFRAREGLAARGADFSLLVAREAGQARRRRRLLERRAQLRDLLNHAMPEIDKAVESYKLALTADPANAAAARARPSRRLRGWSRAACSAPASRSRGSAERPAEAVPLANCCLSFSSVLTWAASSASFFWSWSIWLRTVLSSLPS